MRQLLAALTAAALVAAAGCSSPSRERTTADVSSTPVTAEPAPSPLSPPSTAVKRKTLSRAQAAKRYLEIVRPYNVALERLEQAFNAGKPVVTVRALAGEVARSNAAHMRKLRASAWPAAVRAPMKELLAESAAAQRYWRAAAEASTREELARSVVAASRHSGSGPASEIRRVLGLGDYDEEDYPSKPPSG